MEAPVRRLRNAALTPSGHVGTPPDVQFDRLVRLATLALGADAAMLDLADDRFYRKIWYDPQGVVSAGSTDATARVLGQRVVASEMPIRIDEIPCESAAEPNMPWRGEIRAYLVVPVRAGLDVIGAVAVVQQRPRAWSAEDVATLEDVAGAISTEIQLRVDLGSLQATEQKLRESENRFRAVFDACGLGIAVVDSAGRVERSNPALSQMLEYEASELEHHSIETVVHPDDLRIDRDQLEELCLGNLDRYQVEKRFIRRDGSTLWGRLTVTAIDHPNSDHPSVLEIIEDVTASKETEAELRQLSLTDALTGLHNRRGFLHLAEQQWKLARKKHQRLTLLYADVDGFKRINDAYGHSVGDMALVELARLLRSRYRESDLVARMGGDEFVVLAVEADCDDVTLTERLEISIEGFNREKILPFDLEVSLGVIRFPPADTRSLAELLEVADREMYEAKKRPRETGSAA